MDYSDRLGKCGVVPVVVLEDAGSAVATANALLKGGVDVMEITFRTAAAADSIKAVAEECPDVVVGAGTVVTLEQCKQAIACGAKFIVSPGFDEEVVRYCVEKGITITPGCVTPTEIMSALKYGIKIIKFFPAGAFGGLSTMKALSGPFPQIKFIPTGGVNEKNLGEYIEASFIHAVGGSWMCNKNDISCGNYENITALCEEARSIILGYEVAHVGINSQNSEESIKISECFNKAFDFSVKRGNSSNFASTGIEIMNEPYLGENGHIAIKTNNIDRAIADLEKKGFIVNQETAKCKNNKTVAIYLNDEIGGFAVHLLQK